MISAIESIRLGEVHGETGAPIVVALVPPGARYGLRGACLNKGEGANGILVEFYDGRGAPGAEWDREASGKFGPLGHFINRYNFPILGGFAIGTRAYVSRRGKFNLMDGDADWQLTPEQAQLAMELVAKGATDWLRANSPKPQALGTALDVP